jgi:hypothetical protein
LQQKTQPRVGFHPKTATMSAGFRLARVEFPTKSPLIPAINRLIGKNPRALFPNRKPSPLRRGKQLNKRRHLTKKIGCSLTGTTLRCPKTPGYQGQATEGKFIEDTTKAQAAYDLREVFF